jgi:hypothetical protein
MLSTLPSNIKNIRDGHELWIGSDSYTWSGFTKSIDLVFIEDYEVKGNTLSIRSYRDWCCVPCQDIVDITGIDHKDVVTYLARYIPPYMKKINNKDITLAELGKKCHHFYTEEYSPPLMWSTAVTEKVKDSIAYVLNIHFHARGCDREVLKDLLNDVDTDEEKARVTKDMEDDAKYDRLDIFYRLKDGSESGLWNVNVDVADEVVVNFLRMLLPTKLMSLL